MNCKESLPSLWTYGALPLHAQLVQPCLYMGGVVVKDDVSYKCYALPPKGCEFDSHLRYFVNISLNTLCKYVKKIYINKMLRVLMHGCAILIWVCKCVQEQNIYIKRQYAHRSGYDRHAIVEDCSMKLVPFWHKSPV